MPSTDRCKGECSGLHVDLKVAALSGSFVAANQVHGGLKGRNVKEQQLQQSEMRE
jgi:hypothetical protein